MKLFNLGLPKSGTTTLQTALTRSSMLAAHWKFRQTQLIGPRKPSEYVGQAIYKSYLKGGDPLEAFSGFDAITQADVIQPPLNLWPQTNIALLKQIVRYHPNCVFLLLTRDPAKIADSIMRWSDLHERLQQFGAPGLSMMSGCSSFDLERWAENHFLTMRRIFGGGDRFLEIDIDDENAAKKLGNTIGVPISWWGTANANTSEPTARSSKS